MASIISKKIGRHTYCYLAESARVGGRPRIVSQRYLGKAADIEAMVVDSGWSALLAHQRPSGGSERAASTETAVAHSRGTPQPTWLLSSSVDLLGCHLGIVAAVYSRALDM